MLSGLNELRCPECGRPFDPTDPASVTYRPPLMFWRLWLPGVTLAAAVGALSFAVLLLLGSAGWALTLATPAVMGALVGYGCRIWWVAIVATIIALLAGIGGIVMLGLSGALCALVALVIMIGPALLGAGLGIGLRHYLKHSSFDQADYLPLGLMVLVIPATAAVESVVGADPPIEVVRTARVLDVPLDAAWQRLAFYEDLPDDKPWLLRWMGPVPVRTLTTVDDSGVTRLCVYERGHLRKRVTTVAPQQVLAFTVIEQHIGEEHAVELLDGRFEFVATGAERTQVTLETRYRPQLTPRWCWRPFERGISGQVHEHVLSGMARHAPGAGTLAALAVPVP